MSKTDESGKVIAFPTVVDAELVDESAAAVDTPATDGSTWLDRLRSQDRQPIVPPYLRSLAEAKQAASWVGSTTPTRPVTTSLGRRCTRCGWLFDHRVACCSYWLPPAGT
jgi:hypothetical protein